MITLPAPAPTASVEAELAKAALRVVSGIVAYARQELLETVYAERDRFHARDEAGANARSIIEAMRREADRLAISVENDVKASIEREGKRHTGRWKAVVRSQAQIDVGLLLRDDDLVDVLAVKSEQANGLIRNLAADIHARIERETLEAIFAGRGNDDIAKSLRGIEGIGRNRARLIARDQASKLNAAMNAYRQEQAGVTHYKWKTILDGRERDSHRKNNGKVFPWATPPAATGHPGHDINCRCRALAILIDDEEDAAKLVGPGTDDVDLEAALPEIEKASSLYRTPVAGLGREDLLLRKAELAGIRGQVDALRATSSITETDAERVFAAVFGFGPEGQDLARMAGASAAKANLSSRRALLFSAVKARLDTIDEILEHAAETAPAATVAIKPPPKPDPLAKRFPKGRYHERVAGDPIGLDNAVDKGRDFVRREGKRTGHEWAVMHDEQGRILAITSVGKKNYVEFYPSTHPELYTAGQRVTVHHNHPNSPSFSPADLKVFKSFPGLDTLYAHGHDGSVYKVRVPFNRDRLPVRVKAAEQFAKRFLQNEANARRITAVDANLLYSHAYSLIMGTKGWAAYTFTLAGENLRASIRAQEVLERMLADAERKLSD